MSLTKKAKTDMVKTLSSQDELKYRRKYKELKRRIRDIENDNNRLTERLQKAKKNVQRLRLERKIENTQNENGVASTESDISSGSESEEGVGVSDVDETRKFRRGRKDKGLKPRKPKDPNAPKRPGNVFFLYCRMERDKMKQEYPEEQLGDLTKLLGQRWKSLSADEKKKYYDIYNKENEDYETKMKDYTPKTGPPSDATLTSKGGRPPVKRPRSSDMTGTPASPNNNTPVSHPQIANVRADNGGGTYSELGSEVGSEEQYEDMEEGDEDGFDEMEDGEGINGDAERVDDGGQGERRASFGTESEGSQERTTMS